ncbi:hypothetical protein L226DRAFT_527366 [Lentinus tigrinus ALCF2SS1-7]|uniref:Uncharacterized protein n=1 Tax=Lentinus tigrinus ALCF2SS1-6 TaxID=1328759 RepID=A0A5C2RPE2_9APHY|nr:hypothetical protein L227DRAFT_568246 [Lentinus tigrinus ALCF2SS1-6]RPD68218.1 hypothetical protein L226DRAFT_527366 [Lentinus tigrinus ALCF2SS1-7]
MSPCFVSFDGFNIVPTVPENAVVYLVQMLFQGPSMMSVAVTMGHHSEMSVCHGAPVSFALSLVGDYFLRLHFGTLMRANIPVLLSHTNVMRTFGNEEDTQPRIQNMITHGGRPVLIRNQEVGNAHFQPIVDHGPAWPDTAFAILPFDETMSLLSEGKSEQKVYLLRGPGQLYDFDDQEIWADDLSNLVIETGDHQMVIDMQPQYEDDEEDWLLGILLNNEEDDEVED